jgi:hypothetical protein
MTLKKFALSFCMNACDLLNCQKLFISVAFDGVCTGNNIFRRVRKISKSDYYHRHVCLSIHQHGTTQLGWTAFHEI